MFHVMLMMIVNVAQNALEEHKYRFEYCSKWTVRGHCIVQQETWI